MLVIREKFADVNGCLIAEHGFVFCSFKVFSVDSNQILLFLAVLLRLFKSFASFDA